MQIDDGFLGSRVGCYLEKKAVPGTLRARVKIPYHHFIFRVVPRTKR